MLYLGMIYGVRNFLKQKNKFFLIQSVVCKRYFFMHCKYEKQWPPHDCSPFHPIEPWGKQFFIFNALRPNKFVEAQDLVSNNNLLPKSKGDDCEKETVLCVTDYRKTPLMYLVREDFNVLCQSIDSIYDELLKFERKLDNFTSDNRLELQKEFVPRRSYRMQKTKKGEHCSYGIFRGARRMKK
ncbi:conserved Plasmodium protein, unknown function [Babesia microti strain RI]|uniref:Uncharacterized protein n=1 Tax=Babesia microti (strain RI) TaxID=1133968 RepID=I7I7X3_BABMR|nr:conserved Plasmodium protein, unknown function [Babesia microti strain RI]CCF72713.1 conserved Plasmodium protein, unknown function [Babesia microti strain RI]|eukprot:XP_012647322.1 conserved Plasmodium protein, unknown function [Babesia microti strain RI]